MTLVIGELPQYRHSRFDFEKFVNTDGLLLFTPPLNPYLLL